MFNVKTYISNSLVILTTALACSIIIINRENNSLPESKSSTTLSQQVTEETMSYSISTYSDELISQATISPSSSDTTNTTDTTDKPDEEIKINTYIVQSGDTVDSIAKSFNLSISTVTESNGLSVSSTLEEGQIIEIPSVDGVIYKMKDGDTLWGLAVLNKADINEILEINKIEAPEKIQLGQKVIIPGVDKVQSEVVSTKDTKKSTSSDMNGIETAANSKTSLSRGGSMPTNGTISSKFGQRWGRQHSGIDIAAPVGTDVHAFMDGEVTFSGWKSGYGYTVVIDHGNGLESYYAHNSKLLVKSGDTVKEGTHIAEVGSTGNSTGPHSHFEIRENGTAVDPYLYVK